MGADRIEDIESVGDRPGSQPIDVSRRLVAEQLEVHVGDATRRLLGSIGRTEDVVISPRGDRLAVAAFNADAVAIVDVAVERIGGAPVVRLGDAVIVRTEGLARPHGMAFVDDDTLLVANRESELVVLDLGGVDVSLGLADVRSRTLIDGAAPVPVRTPGSVATRRIGDGLVEVFVCNNYVHDVTRHILDRSAGWEVVHGETLLSHGLEIPDGIALSHAGDWLAVSNHNTHSVNVYRYDEMLGPASEPSAVLRGMNYPHGLAFTADDQHLLVADAGLPYVLAYRSDDGEWTGAANPAHITRVMDDASFHRGRYNPQEGGPKGLAVMANGVAVVTSEFQPLAFFALGHLLGHATGEIRHDVTELRHRRADAGGVALRRALRRVAASERERDIAESARHALAASLDEAVVARDETVRERDDAVRQRDDAMRQCDDAMRQFVNVTKQSRDVTAERDQAVRERDEARESAHFAEVATLRSRSWRVTAPLRSLTEFGSRLRRPLRG